MSKKNKIRIVVCLLMVVTMFISTGITSLADVGRRYSKFNQSGYSQTGDGPTDMVSIAMKQVGMTNSNFGYTDSWCAAFIVDCAELAGQSYAIPFISGSTHGVSGLRSYVLNRGGAIVTTPQAGDLVFYYDTLYNCWCHVGLMISSNDSVQGNLGGGEVKQTAPARYWLGNNHGYTMEYIRPAYSNTPVTPIQYVTPLVDGETYIIKSVSSGKVLEVSCGTSKKVDLNVWEYTGDPWQTWTCKRIAEGYSFINAYTGQAIDIKNNSQTEAAQLIQYPYDATTNVQKFRLIDAGNGRYGIVSIHNAGRAFDVYQGSTDNGAKVKLCNWASGDNQLWTFESLNKAPYGAIDLIEGNNETIHFAGWARDDDDLTKSLKIHVYVDGGPGEGTWIGEYVENVYRSDLNGTYGFDITLNGITPGTHTVYIYALDSTGTGTNSTLFTKQVVVQPIGEQTISDGRYHIINGFNTEYRLDNPGTGNPPAGSNLIVCNMTEYISDEAFNVKHVGQGYYEISRGDCAIDLEGSKTDLGTNVLMNTKTGSDSQKWAIKKITNGFFKIVSKYSGYELDMDETGESLYGANVAVGINGWSGLDHSWRFLPEGTQTIADGDYYIISAYDENYRLNVSEIANSTKLGIKEANANSTVFSVKWLGTEYYEISIKGTEQCLDAPYSTVSQCELLQTYTRNNQNNQQWVIKADKNGAYNIISKYSALLIDVDMKDGTFNGDKGVLMYGTNGDLNQSWKFVPYNPKEQPSYTVPTNIKADCGTNISSVSLPTGFSWTESTDTVVLGGTGTKDNTKAVYKAKFTPTNTNKYAVVDNINITISVTHSTKFVSNGNGTHSPVCVNNDYVGESIACHSKDKPTCIHVVLCDDCKAQITQKDPSNHYGETEIRNAKDASCYEEGYTGDTYCKACKTKIKDGESFKKVAHTLGVPVKENDIPSTCSEGGSYEKVVYCEVKECKAEISREKIETDVIEHIDEDEDGQCDLCRKKAFENGIWIKDIPDQVYTGKAIVPSVTVYDKSKKLELNKDYAVKITKNVNVGKALVTITGRGNYTNVETVEFNIVPRDIAGEDFAADEIAIKATGKDLTPKAVLTWNGKTLPATSYTYTYQKMLDYENGTNLYWLSLSRPGKYMVRIVGKGNFTGTRYTQLTITEEQKFVSKLLVAKIPSQPYTGSDICPAVTVKDGRTELVEGTDYAVEYFNNTNVGTAYAVVNGLGDYAGSKRVSFAITGTAIARATVEGIPTTVDYSGNAIEFDSIKLYIKATAKTEQINLRKDIDYEVSYLNNTKAGAATVVFTGINGYTGVLKKSFRINAFKSANDISRVGVSLPSSVEYSKGGAKPNVTVTFMNADGTVRTLVEKNDYTVVYLNNALANDGSTSAKLPTVKVTLKGSYNGVITKNFIITPKNLSSVKLEASDKVYTGRPNTWKSVVVATDTDGKKLAANRDYETVVEYKYSNGKTVQTSDVVLADTVITATIKAKAGGNYTGTASCTYRISRAAITSAKVSIATQTYTGKAVEPKGNEIVVTMSNVPLNEGIDYEIVPGSYTNNINKGTASVTIRGIGNYGGTKKVNFAIRAKGFSWWWR